MTYSSTSVDPRAVWAAARPDLDTSAMEVVGPIKRIERLLATAVEALYEGAPLTAPELDVLVQLRHTEGPVIARRLSENMRCSRAAVSKTLAKLEKRGFVERRPSPADRRAALVTVTAAGRDAVDAMFPRQLAVEAALLKGLGADRDRVVEALNLLERVMEQRAGRQRV
ncbi:MULTISPECIES: MarR family winged helix-turn-helix transcriptional regulator [Streptomyces]|uniref:MarR family winged helix-turn-helix transcriptional regulator n=1 Tax=Streptomyces TaxID=1883 RepID=UPI000A38DE80|nr:MULTISPECIES: MarR family transcriptional regulator [Streptomyces]MDX3583124.1 MarR family transcriptional regulator [Streptomyces europaeiscabiei]MDX3613839.1 MarR family transcriptional regulator [Streptomyces europaeiscabiei]MDX3633978.1 MarR family transcriptional regulator [Streptomyces europaeiscabiei]MDX3651441.1 MarR family transcriptional regulator [Streptomyces europaeiscabiei]WUD35350.1 MarR family transcriptional regulator [Streptomyces europaeiscabiei]